MGKLSRLQYWLQRLMLIPQMSSLFQCGLSRTPGVPSRPTRPARIESKASPCWAASKTFKTHFLVHVSLLWKSRNSCSRVLFILAWAHEPGACSRAVCNGVETNMMECKLPNSEAETDSLKFITTNIRSLAMAISEAGGSQPFDLQLVCLVIPALDPKSPGLQIDKSWMLRSLVALDVSRTGNTSVLLGFALWRRWRRMVGARASSGFSWLRQPRGPPNTGT